MEENKEQEHKPLKREKSAMYPYYTVKESIDFMIFELPKAIEDKCREYVKSNGLMFGAIDLIIVDGKFSFFY